MRIGVFAVLLSDRSLEDALDHVRDAGCEAVEIATGGYVGDAHCQPAELLDDARAREAFRRAVDDRGLEISALSCHGNPLHPDEALARRHDEQFRATVRLASELGVGQVVTFSGCPGDSETSTRPSWVTCPWPEDFLETLEWQWNERAAPYWSEVADFCRAQGVRVAVEPHPGFLVYNTQSFRRLREIAGDVIGVNFDPSHLFWQGMDPLVCVRELGDAILHVHAKDTWIDPQNTRVNGVLDTTVYTRVIERSWVFRTVGYGHGAEVWRALVSELRLAGYDHVISIEHEDSLMSVPEGLAKAVSLLQGAIIAEPAGDARWVSE
jgi:sugar phosphate isomerase/epimerase